MNNIIKYNGYYAKVEYSAADNVLHGKIEGITDLVTFQCDNVNEIKSAFEEAVDDYLEICMEVGKEPEKMYKGTFNVRISPEIHRSIALDALERGVTLNRYVENAIQQYYNLSHMRNDNLCVPTASYNKHNKIVYGRRNSCPNDFSIQELCS